jgi:cytochrome c peroxidase
MVKKIILFAFAILAVFSFRDGWAEAAPGHTPTKQERSAIVRLGERLFKDDRFSTPKGDLPASCSHCHLLDQDPQGLRAYADFFNRSWVSSRSQDPRRFELRNSPTIFNAGEMPRLHYDGEFGSLEDLVKGTLTGRPMGWLPGEEAQAFEQARAVVLNDRGEIAYRDEFKKAFGVELESLSRDETANLIARAVAEYCRTLNARMDSAYDRFVELNKLEIKPATGESAKDFARRLVDKINSLERAGALKLTKDFNKTALDGLRVFFRADGGNCAACHAPPLFTDNSFHNIGISQREYDRFHGEGKFAELQIPDAATAKRPSPQFRETPSREKPNRADLGFWNFVDLKTSPLRREGESDDHFLERMTAAFKTPTLRNLKYTHPYFHDGSLHTLEDVIGEMMRLSEMARDGRLREPDEELARIKILASEIEPLAAFLNALNEDLTKQPYREK